jgi:hypothetical protein
VRFMDSVILRRSRRIWPPNGSFLSLWAQILRCAQDDKRSARMHPSPCNSILRTACGERTLRWLHGRRGWSRLKLMGDPRAARSGRFGIRVQRLGLPDLGTRQGNRQRPCPRRQLWTRAFTRRESWPTVDVRPGPPRQMERGPATSTPGRSAAPPAAASSTRHYAWDRPRWMAGAGICQARFLSHGGPGGAR